jgi:serine protease AprX
MPEERLFLKVILPKQGKETKNPPGGSPPKPFKDVSTRFRARLIEELAPVAEQLSQAATTSPFVPMRVQLETKATAKSHRPDQLFFGAGCPIIGTDRPGELYVQMSNRGLSNLRGRIARGDGDAALKALSTIRHFSPVKSAERLGGESPQKILAAAPKAAGQKAQLKVRLFRYPDQGHDVEKRAVFAQTLTAAGITFRPLGSAAEHEAYVLECQSVEQVENLAEMTMVRSVSAMPTLRVLHARQLTNQPVPSTLATMVPTPSEHPVVAVVDSGITDKLPVLKPWIYGRQSYVAAAEENRNHGTFVSGLLVWGHELNPGHPEIEPLHCRLMDVQVLPNDDPAVGQVGSLTEPVFLQNLEECLKQHANEIKVWNISLASSEVCSLDHFSSLAVELDALQERYNVSFVIAVGNYSANPMPSFPRSDAACALSRIAVPADSVLGISVGAIAHIDLKGHGALRGEPSPFSRNGPGPNYVIKPDLVHLGGNIGHGHTPMLGLLSLSDGPVLSENVGTSFATPLVARQLAHIYHSITPTPSATVARAILTHCARDLRTNDRVPDGEDHYFGFGMPVAVRSALECKPWSMTLVFEEQLRPGYFLEWNDFPYPPSLLADGKYNGEISMTLAFPPRRNADYGAEYCETHIEASFGVFTDGKEGEEFHGQVPVEHSRAQELYESFQVKNLRKWAPVRTHYRLLPRGVTGKRWRLKVRLLSRHATAQTVTATQSFALILTIADPRKQAPVYDEMAQILRTRFQTNNLTLRPTVRVQTQSNG